MSTMETTITVEREQDGEMVELEITVRGDVYGGSPGRTYGPPERCFEPEPARVEGITATLNGQPFELTESELETADEALQEKAGEEADDPWGDVDDEPDYDRHDCGYDY